MLKALLKKQFLSVLSRFGTKKGAGQKGAVKYGVLLLALALMMGFMFFSYSYMLAAPLEEQGLGWLYFVYAGVMAVTFSVVGSVFMTQSCLYEAKDNDMLLSMPIPSKYILFVRMVPLYAQNLLFEAAVMIPACICRSMVATVTAGQAFIWAAIMLLQPFLTLFITCSLGLLMSLITSKLRDKTLVTVIVSIAFLALYFIMYSVFMSDPGALLNGAAGIADGIKSTFYPLYALGAACLGDGVGFVITLAIIAALFGGMYIALSKTYILIVTSRRGGRSAKYDGRIEKPASVGTALIKKELKRFFGSGVYLLNCGLGAILLVLATLMFVIRGGEMLPAAGSAPELAAALPLVMVLVVSVISAMDEVTAPSVSLEGKTLWILQSAPVDMWKVLKAKLTLHYIITAPVATMCMAVFAIMLRPSWAMIILMLIAPSVAVMVSGVFGLLFNLKKPNLNWENETVVLKQSASVLLTMLTVWGIFGALAGLYFAAALVMSMEVYLLIVLIMLSALIAGLTVWLRRRGVAILKEL